MYEAKAKPAEAKVSAAEAKAKAAEAKAAQREEKAAQAKAKAEAKAKAQALKQEAILAEAKAKAAAQAKRMEELAPKAKAAAPPVNIAFPPTTVRVGNAQAVLIGGEIRNRARDIREAQAVPPPQARSAYMPVRYRKIAPIDMSVVAGPVPTGVKIANDDNLPSYHARASNGHSIKPTWTVSERFVPKASSGMLNTPLENRTGERKVNIEKLTGLKADQFQKLFNLL
jgi:hypothetical protein